MNQKKARPPKPAGWKFLVALLGSAIVLGGLIFYAFSSRPWTEGIPRYFTNFEAAKPLPATLDPTKFSDRNIAAAYVAAKTVPGILAQQPCFCHCDRKRGHRSLLDCFASKHAAECDICINEAILAMHEPAERQDG